MCFPCGRIAFHTQDGDAPGSVLRDIGHKDRMAVGALAAGRVHEHVSRLGYACSDSHRDMEK